MKYIMLILLFLVSNLTSANYTGLGYDCFHGNVENPYRELLATVFEINACPAPIHPAETEIINIGNHYYKVGADGNAIIPLQLVFKHLVGDPDCRVITQSNNI